MSLQRIRSCLPRPLVPGPGAFSAHFWEELAEGRFVTTRCRACGRISFPPRAGCPTCGDSRADWVVLNGHGRLYSRTRIHAAGGPFACWTPYSVGIVDLDENVRLLTRLLPEASALPLDTRVQLVVVVHPDGPLFAATASRPTA